MIRAWDDHLYAIGTRHLRLVLVLALPAITALMLIDTIGGAAFAGVMAACLLAELFAAHRAKQALENENPHPVGLAFGPARVAWWFRDAPPRATSIDNIRTVSIRRAQTSRGGSQNGTTFRLVVDGTDPIEVRALGLSPETIAEAWGIDVPAPKQPLAVVGWILGWTIAVLASLFVLASISILRGDDVSTPVALAGLAASLAVVATGVALARWCDRRRERVIGQELELPALPLPGAIPEITAPPMTVPAGLLAVHAAGWTLMAVSGSLGG